MQHVCDTCTNCVRQQRSVAPCELLPNNQKLSVTSVPHSDGERATCSCAAPHYAHQTTQHSLLTLPTAACLRQREALWQHTAPSSLCTTPHRRCASVQKAALPAYVLLAHRNFLGHQRAGRLPCCTLRCAACAVALALGRRASAAQMRGAGAAGWCRHAGSQSMHLQLGARGCAIGAAAGIAPVTAACHSTHRQRGCRDRVAPSQRCCPRRWRSYRCCAVVDCGDCETARWAVSAAGGRAHRTGGDQR